MSCFKSLVNRIDSLPPLSDSAQRILALYALEEENVDMTRLTNLVEEDPLLTANILGMINNPRFGFNNKITSVKQAITLFGTRMLKGFVMSYAMKEHVKLDMSVYGVTNEKFNDMCQLQSALLYQWYMAVDVKRAQVLVPLALIMETGKVVFAQVMSDSDYAHLFTEELLCATDMQEIEHKYSDTSSYFIGGLLFDHWHFSKRYINIMKSLDFVDESIVVDALDLDILEVIRTAINVRGFLNKENLDKATALVKSLGMDEPAFMHAALRIKNAYEDTQKDKLRV